MMMYESRVTVMALAVGLAGLLMVGCAPTEATSESPEVPVSETAEVVPPVPVEEGRSETVDVSAPVSIAQEAIEKSAEAEKYLFVFVAAEDAPETGRARDRFEQAANALADKADAVSINRDSDTESVFVRQFALDHAPMPIVLAMAPTGVMTGAVYGEQLQDPKLDELIAGPAEQQVLKILQEQKLVLLCLQNDGTEDNDAAMRGINEFKSDKRFSEFTEVITLDPATETEQRFLGNLHADSGMSQATTLFLAPPNRLLTRIEGETTKDALIAALMAGASSGCCPAH